VLDGNFQNFLFLWVSEQFGFWSSEIFRKYLGFSNSRKFCDIKLEISSKIISCFWVKKPCFEGFGVKVQKTGIYEHSKFTENSEFVIFQTFQKLQKNHIKIEFQKTRKTCSNSKTNLNVWFRVWNAGPYLIASRL